MSDSPIEGLCSGQVGMIQIIFPELLITADRADFADKIRFCATTISVINDHQPFSVVPVFLETPSENLTDGSNPALLKMLSVFD